MMIILTLVAMIAVNKSTYNTLSLENETGNSLIVKPANKKQKC
jgi:hypothetical protein